MDSQIIELSWRGLALVPVVMAVVQVAKIYISSFWSPLIALAVGVGLSYAVGGVTMLDSALLGGLVVGLMACGAYSGVARMIPSKKE